MHYHLFKEEKKNLKLSLLHVVKQQQKNKLPTWLSMKLEALNNLHQTQKLQSQTQTQMYPAIPRPQGVRLDSLRLV